MVSVVEGCVFGKETFAGWGVVGVADVGEDFDLWLLCGGLRLRLEWVTVGVRICVRRVIVADDAYAEFVGAAFEAECDHRDGVIASLTRLSIVI